jgi:hypothetical protein
MNLAESQPEITALMMVLFATQNICIPFFEARKENADFFVLNIYRCQRLLVA